MKKIEEFYYQLDNLFYHDNLFDSLSMEVGSKSLISQARRATYGSKRQANKF